MTSTAFSNNSEYETWSAHWCKKCARDEEGTAPEGRFCNILSNVIVTNLVPKEWSPGRNDLHDRYHCSEFITGATPDYPEQWHAPLCHSQDGTIIHKVGCPMAYGGKPWQWSTDQPMGNVRIVAGQAGWLACGHCKPFA